MGRNRKMLVNNLHHATVVGGLTMGCAKLGQIVFKGTLPKVDFIKPRDFWVVVIDLSGATTAKDMLIKQAIIPANNNATRWHPLHCSCIRGLSSMPWHFQDPILSSLCHGALALTKVIRS